MPVAAVCEEQVAKQFPRLSGSREASWSYTKCPNVNECKLKLAHCHPDAHCVDTAESYRCVCNRGFKGDGNVSCVETYVPSPRPLQGQKLVSFARKAHFGVSHVV